MVCLWTWMGGDLEIVQEGEYTTYTLYNIAFVNSDWQRAVFV